PAFERKLQIIRPIVNHATAKYGVGDVGAVLEGIAVIEDEVGDFAGVEAAVLGVDVQDAGRLQGDAREGAVEAQSVHHGDRRFKTQHARFGDIPFERGADGD